MHAISYAELDVDHCADHQDRRHQDRRHQDRRHLGRHHLGRHQDRQDVDQNQDVDHRGHLDHQCEDRQGLYVDHRGHLDHQCEDRQGHQCEDRQGQDVIQDQVGNQHLCDQQVHYRVPFVDQEEEEWGDQKETWGQEAAGWGDHLVHLQCEAASLEGIPQEVFPQEEPDAWSAAD